MKENEETTDPNVSLTTRDKIDTLLRHVVSIDSKLNRILEFIFGPSTPKNDSSQGDSSS